MKPGTAVIAGIGHTTHGEHPGRGTLSLNVEACREALVDAGISKQLVNGLYVKYPTSSFEPMYGQKLAERLGLQPRIGGVWDAGGASNIAMIEMAALAVDAGRCDVALITAADNPRTATRIAYERPWGDDALYGFFGTPAGYALIAQRHMAVYGTTSEQLGLVAVNGRRNGAANPRAQKRSPLSLDEYLASPMVVEPLRRADCCLISDGGAAVIVTSAKRASELGIAHAVPILGIGQGQTSWDLAVRPDLTRTCATESGAGAFAMAGLTPADIDVAQIYDCFTIVVPMTLEAYGFCEPGGGGRFIEQDGIGIDGALPVNTSGGMLAESGMPGMQLVIEGVRQMRAESSSQVPGARTCIISNQGGIMHTHATMIVGQP